MKTKLIVAILLIAFFASNSSSAGVITILQDSATLSASAFFDPPRDPAAPIPSGPCGATSTQRTASYAGPAFGADRTAAASIAGCVEATATLRVGIDGVFGATTGVAEPRGLLSTQSLIRSVSSLSYTLEFAVSGSDITARVVTNTFQQVRLFDLRTGQQLLGPLVFDGAPGPITLADGGSYRLTFSLGSPVTGPNSDGLNGTGSFFWTNVTSIASVPEPAALGLLALGLLGASRARRRQSTAQKQ
jgi:hypothetical protein